MYETLQSIVDQLEFCGYQTKDGLHELKMNAAFIALKERAAAENCGSKTVTMPNKQSVQCSVCGGILMLSEVVCYDCHHSSH